MRTLLADDNGEIRAALRLLLEELATGDVAEAADLSQAAAALAVNPPDVVLLDWELPDGGYWGTAGERAPAAGGTADAGPVAGGAAGSAAAGVTGAGPAGRPADGTRAGAEASWEAHAACRRFVLHAKTSFPGCRVIAMSGRPEARQEALRAGCDAFVGRNDPPDSLLALLEGEGQG